MDVLVVSHMPWTKSAGGPQGNVMLAEHLREMGHRVDKYTFEDAFPEKNVFVRYFGGALFPWKAVQHVRHSETSYDLIQADQGNLPASKRYMRTDATVVYNSHGLYHHHKSYGKKAPSRKKNRTRGSVLGRLAGYISNKLTKPEFLIEQSVRHADAISAMNRDELRFAESHFPDKHVVLKQGGLSQQRLSALNSVASEDGVEERPTVGYIGVWNPRKGALDLPPVFQTIRRQHPGAAFRLLGTGQPRTEVLRDIPEPLQSDVEVVPSYSYEELPQLLRGITVGVLPSYIEGFGYAVLEMLAAGIPVVTYDVPGPRDMLQKLPKSLMVPAAEKESMGRKISDLLTLDPSSYEQLSRECMQAAGQFQWSDIIRRYVSALEDPETRQVHSGG
ncbi:hypothetical protein BSZ35_11120 [Salinibacter sp. 10B]|uniref:glycosyltransferase family 4 protein n=1 Tax=Salinibacter sp. 10B TaxID=1923971 RepID=UPI000CF4175B|nr:glycosyltransferase family 4 protein [Salinibacter sp. 10B]PQJ35072.1 hypothetical protein BSZ35_11120 [Salinibacter sp. 10B]